MIPPDILFIFFAQFLNFVFGALLGVFNTLLQPPT